MKNAYMVSVALIDEDSQTYSFVFKFDDDDKFAYKHKLFDSIKAVGDLDGRHLLSISAFNEGTDTPDGVYLYQRTSTPPVNGRQRCPGIAVWLREHGYNAVNHLPRLCFELVPPSF